MPGSVCPDWLINGMQMIQVFTLPSAGVGSFFLFLWILLDFSLELSFPVDSTNTARVRVMQSDHCSGVDRNS